MNMKQTWNADLYNQKHSFVYSYGESLVQLLAPQAHERILDLGCGSGQLTQKISEMAGEAIGLDKSVQMISDARLRYPSLQFEVGDAADFSFDIKFDAVFSNATLHWVTDYENAAYCMYECLKPGGQMVVEFGGKGNVAAIVNQLIASLQERGYTKQAQEKLWYYPSIAEYTTVLERVGFRVLVAQHYDRPTELAEVETGIIDWLTMFAGTYFSEVTEAHVEEIKKEVQHKVKSQLFKVGKWFADYKRIRVIAIK
jgi:trans-aconitate methyltransferase